METVPPRTIARPACSSPAVFPLWFVPRPEAMVPDVGIRFGTAEGPLPLSGPDLHDWWRPADLNLRPSDHGTRASIQLDSTD